MSEPNYTINHDIPSVDTYRHLRQASGLSAKTQEAASRGIHAVPLDDGAGNLEMWSTMMDGRF